MNQRTQTTKKQIRVGYGVKIPILSFGDTLRIVREVSRVGGLDGMFDALSQVTGNSLSSSSFQLKLGVLKNFGFITTQGSNYSLTEVGRRLAQPSSPDEESSAIFEAFRKLEVLSKVFDNYKGKILPQKDYLANYIEKNLNIPTQLKHGWADYFIDAAKVVSVLHEREGGSYQVLSQPSKLQNPIPSNGEGSVGQVVEPQESPPARAMSPVSGLLTTDYHWGILNQRRVSGNRKAIFAIPDELSTADIEALKLILKGIEASLDGLKESGADSVE